MELYGLATVLCTFHLTQCYMLIYRKQFHKTNSNCVQWKVCGLGFLAIYGFTYFSFGFPTENHRFIPKNAYFLPLLMLQEKKSKIQKVLLRNITSFFLFSAIFLVQKYLLFIIFFTECELVLK